MKSLEQAKNDDERAKALGERARGYSEKTRYSAFAQCIDAAEYNRLVGLALDEHGKAIALAPKRPEPCALRGQTYFDRANVTGLNLNESKDDKNAWVLRAPRASWSRTCCQRIWIS